MSVRTVADPFFVRIVRLLLTGIRRCDHLIQLGIDKGMQRAQIIPYGGNQLIDSSTRTNTAAWLNYNQDAVVTRIENELARYTKTHPLDGESLQILHYGNGQAIGAQPPASSTQHVSDCVQAFKPHRDAFDPNEDPPVRSSSSPRVA